MITESFQLPSIYDFIEEKKIDKIFEAYVAEASERNPEDQILEDVTIDEFRVISAIEGRNYVGIYYEEPNDPDGTTVLKGFRLCECYVYGTGYVYRGKTIHSDRSYLRVYVIRDTNSDPLTRSKFKTKRKSVSKSQHVPFWRLMRMDRIKEFTTIPKVFSTYRELYNPDDKVISDIIASISKDDFPKGQSNLRLPRDLRNKVNKKK